METFHQSNLLLRILTKSKPILYEILKFYGYTHENVKLLKLLWSRTRDIYIEMKDTAFFNETRKITSLNPSEIRHLIKIIELQSKKQN